MQARPKRRNSAHPVAGHGRLARMNLESILAPVPQADFLENSWGKKLLHAGGVPGKFKQLFSWEDLNTLLSTQKLDPQRLVLSHRGKVLEGGFDEVTRPAHSPHGGMARHLKPGSLNKLLRDGTTLVLNAVDEMHPRVRDVSAEISGVFLAETSVNLYASWGSEDGFGLHWDDHDVFILQIGGRKRWRVYEPTRPSPRYRDLHGGDRRTGKLRFNKLLHPGDVLYIPGGHWHRATAIDEPTLHLTVGVNVPGGIDLLRSLVDELRKDDFLRGNVPMFSGPRETQAYNRRVATAVARALSGGGAMRDFLERRRAMLGAGVMPSLPFAAAGSLPAGDDYAIRWAGVVHTRIKQEGATIAVSCMGKRYTFERRLMPLLKTLLSRGEFSFSALAQAHGDIITEAALRDLLVQLLHEGFLVVEPLAGRG